MYRARQGVAHRLITPTMVSHAEGCGCDFIRTVSYATWISYDMVDGRISCSRCGKVEFLPTPHVKVNQFDMDCDEVYMDHEAVMDDLNRFKLKHQDCKQPLKPESELDN